MRIHNYFIVVTLIVLIRPWAFASPANVYPYAHSEVPRAIQLQTYKQAPVFSQSDPRDIIFNCQATLTGTPVITTKPSGVDLVRITNRAFADRGWSQEFLNERLEIAEKFRHRSEYVYVQLGKEIIGVLGLTWAEYTNNQLQDLDSLELLPMEDSHDWRVKRPLSYDGTGVVFELRSYFMIKKYNQLIRPYLFEGIFKSIITKLADRKDLYTSDILNTYGDSLSLKHYSRMKFIPSDLPIKLHKGNEWTALANSPIGLEQEFRRMRGLTYTEGLSHDFEITTPAGHQVIVDGALPVAYMARNKGSAWSFTPKRDYEVASGWWAKAGKKVIFRNGKNDSGLFSITLAKDTEVSPGIWAAKNSDLLFWPNGQVMEVHPLLHPVKLPQFKEPVWLGVSFYSNGKIREVRGFSKGFVHKSGLELSKWSRVRLRPDGTIQKLK